MAAITQAESYVNAVVDEKSSGAILATSEESKNNTPKDEDTSTYLEGWGLWSLGLALMSSAFMLSLDNTILATAIPRITSDFNSLNDIGWYGSAYKITQMALLPTCGRIFTFYDVRWSYIVLLLIFELGSVICAVAQNSTTLIVGRAVAGVGAAGLMSGAAIIVSYCVTLRKRPVLMGLISVIYGVASVLGPLIGGVITDSPQLTWRFCFWVNLPFGAIGLVQIWFALRHAPPAAQAGLAPKKKIRQLDLPGATILISAVTALLLALQWGGIVYPWSNAKVYGCFIAFGLGLILFGVMQWKDQNSCTVPLHLFRNRTVCAASGFMVFLQMAVTTQTYYWPIYFQSVKGTSAKDSGIYMFPFAIASMFSSLAAGWITYKVGYYVPFMWVGSSVLATGAGLFQLLHSNSPASRWAGFQIVSAFGFGICGQIPLISVQVVLPKEDVPTGLCFVIFFECLGGALATSIAQNIFTDSLLKKLGGIDGIDAPAVVAAGAKDFVRLIPPELLDRVIEVFKKALGNVFILPLASALLALVISGAMEWRRLPPKDDKPGDETTG